MRVTELGDELYRESPVFLVRDGHRYLLTQADYEVTKAGEEVISITATFNLVDTKDAKPFHMTQPIPVQLFNDLDYFNKHRQETPGKAFVIEMKKNADGSGQLSWELMGLRDPSDRRYM